MPKKLVNPETGRLITVGGPTHMRLMSHPKGHVINPRTGRKIKIGGPSFTRLTFPNKSLWSHVQPRTVKSKSKMQATCPQCFLLPKEKKFPVCTSGCKFNCQGALAAQRRAAQYGYTSVEKKAKALRQKYCNAKKSRHNENSLDLHIP